MAKSQMDLIVGEHDDPMVLAFEKNAKSSVDKMFKARAKAGKDKGDAVATAVALTPEEKIEQDKAWAAAKKNASEHPEWFGDDGSYDDGTRSDYVQHLNEDGTTSEAVRETAFHAN